MQPETTNSLAETASIDINSLNTEFVQNEAVKEIQKVGQTTINRILLITVCFVSLLSGWMVFGNDDSLREKWKAFHLWKDYNPTRKYVSFEEWELLVRFGSLEMEKD